LGPIDPSRQRQVIERFLRLGPMLPKDQLDGIELDDSLADKLNGRAADHEGAPPPQPAHDAPPFQFLHEATSDVLLPVLIHERAQTIAVVLAHVPPARAADVLAKLPAAQQTAVVRCLVDLDQADPAVLQEVETGLHELLSDRLGAMRRRSVGLKTVEAILAAADGTERREMVRNVSRLDDALLERLGLPGNAAPAPRNVAAEAPEEPKTPPPAKPPATQRIVPSATPIAVDDSPPCPEPVEMEFDQLTQLDSRALAIVLAQAEPEVLLLALTGASPDLVRRIMGQFPSREARRLQRRMQQIGPIRLSDVRQAQQAVARKASELATRGVIRLPVESRRLAMAA